jgi:hypothetical protein
MRSSGMGHPKGLGRGPTELGLACKALCALGYCGPVEHFILSIIQMVFYIISIQIQVRFEFKPNSVRTFSMLRIGISLNLTFEFK